MQPQAKSKAIETENWCRSNSEFDSNLGSPKQQNEGKQQQKTVSIAPRFTFSLFQDFSYSLISIFIPIPILVLLRLQQGRNDFGLARSQRSNRSDPVVAQNIEQGHVGALSALDPREICYRG